MLRSLFLLVIALNFTQAGGQEIDFTLSPSAPPQPDPVVPSVTRHFPTQV